MALSTLNQLISKFDTNDSQTEKGILYYQIAPFTEEQCKCIDKSFEENMHKAPRLLFSDNEINNQRVMEFAKRTYFEEQSSLKKAIKLNYNEFVELMDKPFAKLKAHICRGGDVIVSSPTKQQMENNPQLYLNGTVRHNLGTGVANLPTEYLQYIQNKLNELGKGKYINYPKMYLPRNSIIITPFIINVVCKLLNKSMNDNPHLWKGQIPMNIEAYIDGWGGGLRLLKQCCTKCGITNNSTSSIL